MVIKNTTAISQRTHVPARTAAVQRPTPLAKSSSSDQARASLANLDGSARGVGVGIESWTMAGASGLAAAAVALCKPALHFALMRTQIQIRVCAWPTRVRNRWRDVKRCTCGVGPDV